MSSNKSVRVRFAPSPTGPLHIGGVRTALYNYLFAKKAGGQFLLRIEDTDSQRFVPGAEAYIIESLKWLGIHPDEGVGVGGPHTPYRQSERKAIYKVHVDQLLESGHAYIAFDTPAMLEQKRATVSNFQYDSSTRMEMENSLTLDAQEVSKRLESGMPYVVRFKINPDEIVVVQDLIRGEVKINSNVLDDKVLYKSSDELPTYHLANIVDDHLMEITHVIRGEEWLPSAPLHVLLYRAFGWENQMPAFAHLPLLLKPEGNGKLSKRDGDRLGFPVFPCDWINPETQEKSSGYREAGYFPEAVVNFLALMGWHPEGDRELLTMDELIESFSLERCSKSGAKFDYEKGKWFNHTYLQKKPIQDLSQIFVEKILQKKGVMVSNSVECPDFDQSQFSEAYIQTALLSIRERAQFVDDLWDQASFFFERPESYAEKNVQKFWKTDTAEVVKKYAAFLEKTTDFQTEALEKDTMQWIEESGFKVGAVMNALRLALVGASKGPHLFDIVTLIGKKETLLRIERAIDILN